MSSPKRKAQLKEEQEKQWEKDEEERRRKEGLGMWDRIEESGCSADLKDILHRISEHIGLEIN